MRMPCDSPGTQRTASITLDLPQPFGPTTPTEIARNRDVSGIDKRLETGEFDMGETQFVVCKQL